MMRIKLTGSVVCSAVLVYLLTACRSENIDSKDVIAQVNEAVVTNEELENAITQSTSPEVRQALKRKLMEKWVEDEIFYQSALSEGLVLNKGELFLLENYRKQLLVEKYLEKHVDITYRVLDQEIEDYYKLHRSEFVWDEAYAHIIHLVMENRDQMIANEISRSTDLMDVIKKNFFDQQSTLQRPNGDLGYVRLSDLPSRLADQIKLMKTGTIKGPIKTDFGYHYIQLLDKPEPNSVKEMDIVREEVIMRLKLQKRQNEIKRLKQNLRMNFTIQTDLTKLTQSF